MSKLNVQKVLSPAERKLPVFAELEELADRIRIRAFNLFASRGLNEGNDVDDWLTAQREICWPAAELVENDDGFSVSVALAGFAADDILVTATPHEVIVKASRSDEANGLKEREGTKICWSEFRDNDVYRQIEYSSEVDVSKMKANFEHGMLRIEVPKRSEKKPAQKKVKTRSNS